MIIPVEQLKWERRDSQIFLPAVIIIVKSYLNSEDRREAFCNFDL